MSVLLILALLTLAVVLYAASQYFVGINQVGRLCNEPPQWGDELPTLSVIVPARNEERHIEKALQSLLAVNYPNVQITVVDDRSDDQTGAILDRMAAANARLNVVHVDQLPNGWLGKNHAMQLGADRSNGEWLLFTDADIFFDPLTLRHAVPFAVRHGIDHLVLAPNTQMPTWLLKSFVVSFATYFYCYLRPWRVRDPKSSAHIGIGAFNLIRKSVYVSIGGHAPLAMRPDDDLKLGKLVKKNGFRQEILNGMGLIRVEWYASFWELVVGLEKNSFAVVDYHLSAIAASSLALILLNVWPFVALIVTTGAVWWVNLIICLLILAVVARTAHTLSYPLACAVALPVSALVMAWIQWRSAILALRNDGIRWRDTHYSLKELRANRV